MTMNETKQPRILRLTLKRKWFIMILRGIKREEYRENKAYWQKRLGYIADDDLPFGGPSFYNFDFVEFRNGYATDAPTMLVECKGIAFGTGRSDWGGDDTEKFVISLGEIVSTLNTEQLLNAA